jgi:L-alanine-DL-glutamate epimerase-like enolase superfamily enzyme
MRIISAEMKPCVQGLADPTWTFARGKVAELNGWTTLLTGDDGTLGLGYVHAVPSITTHGAGAKAACDFLLPRLVGRDPFSIAEIMAEIDAALAFQPGAKAAIDMALHDLVAHRLGVSLGVLLGGPRRQRIPQGRILSLKAPDEMGRIASDIAGQGYRMVKVKLSGEPDLDIARVAAVRAAIGPTAMMTVDANQTYSAKGMIAAFRHMETHDVALVEQPVPAADWAGLKLVTQTLPVAVEADESAGSVGDVFRLVSDRVADVINLKITKLGGIRNAIAAAQICEAGGVSCRVGAAFGPALLQAFSAHLAASFARLDFPCELSEHLHLTDDPFTPLPVADGMIAVPEGPGCGVTLSEAA